MNVMSTKMYSFWFNKTLTQFWVNFTQYQVKPFCHQLIPRKVVV